MNARLLHEKPAAADLLSISPRTLDRLISEGLIETVTIGRRRYVPQECLEDYVRRLRRAS